MAIQNFKASENEFLGLYVKHLHVHEDSVYFLHEDPFLIQWRTVQDKREHFWRIVCTEKPNVHEFNIEESANPTPFNYSLDNFFTGQHIIHASTFRQQDLEIQSVMLCGFHENDRTYINEIILQFQQHFLRLQAEPIVQLKCHEGTYMKEFNSPTDALIIF